MEPLKHIISHFALSRSRLLATVLFGIIFLLTSSAAPAQEIGTTCQIPSVSKLGETTLTCHFGVDVGKLKLDVKVLHYTTENKALTEIRNYLLLERQILTCLWEEEDLNCMDENYYSLEGELTDTLQLRIPRATEYHVGRYECVIVARQPQKSELCTFILKDESISPLSNIVITNPSPSSETSLKGVKTACGIPSVPKGERTTLTCYFGINVADLHHDVFVYHYISGIEKKSVLTCLWDTERRDCIANLHYSFDHVITDKLHLGVPHAAEHHVGEYACIDTQYEQDSYDVCHFTLKGTAFFNAGNSGDNVNVTTGVSGEGVASWKIAILVSTLCLVCFAMTLFFAFRRRRVLGNDHYQVQYQRQEQ